MILPRLLVITTFLGATALAGAAIADDNTEPAQALFDRGVEQLEQKRYDQACPKIAESYKLDPRPGTLFTLAECETLRGRPATAVARYEEYLALYATLPPDKKAKQGNRPQEARAQKAALVQDLPQLTLLIPANAPRGLTIKLDGSVISEAARGTAVPVDPGQHVVTTQTPGKALKQITLTIQKREKMSLKLDLSETSPSPLPPSPLVESPPSDLPPSTARSSSRRTGAFMAGGIGAAGVVVGAITGGLMLSKWSTISGNCREQYDDPSTVVCANQAGVDAGNSAKTFGLVSSIGWGVGFAGIGAATVLFLTEPPRPKVQVNNGALSPRTNVRSANDGVLSLRWEGSFVVVRRTW